MTTWPSPLIHITPEEILNNLLLSFIVLEATTLVFKEGIVAL